MIHNQRTIQVGFSGVDVDGLYKGPTEYFDDFMYWNSATATGSWSVTTGAAVYQAGLDGTGTFAVADNIEGGALLLTTTTGADDENALQLQASPFFAVAATTEFPRARQLRYKVRFKTGSITLATQYFGMFAPEAVVSAAGTLTVSPATGTQPVGIGFKIVNGVVNYIAKLSSATTATAIGFGSIAINKWYTLEMQMDQYNRWSFWVDGTKYLGNITTNGPLSTTVGLSPVFGIKNGDGTERTMHVDYQYAGVEGPRGRGLLHGAGGPS